MSYPIVSFFYNSNKELWWCNVHQRRATYMIRRVFGDGFDIKLDHCCDPRLGGIMLECSCVDLTDMVEIEE